MKPASAFIDSSVLIAASKPDHIHHVVATDALRCLRELMAKVRVSSLVWAEMNRNTAKHGKHEIPGWIRVLPFDKPAAEVLAAQFPTDRMREVADSGAVRECWSFDAMILATAIAYRSEVIITCNTRDFTKLLGVASDPSSITIQVVPPGRIGDDQIPMPIPMR